MSDRHTADLEKGSQVPEYCEISPVWEQISRTVYPGLESFFFWEINKILWPVVILVIN